MTADYPRQGERIGHYRVGPRLGGGGMGVVFEARDENLERPVALKVISPELAEDAEFRARFTREAQAQALLDSRHVVQVYAHGEDDGRLWIATQLVPDGDLRSMLTAYGAPSVPVAIDLIEQVADGLADAHAAGLVHRDIKPANVLIRRRADGGLTAYLADFGIARQVDGEATRTSHATVGTPSYMAPELHTGGQPGISSDVYSLGCLLRATLTGRAPYAGTSDFEIVTAHREKPVPRLPDDSPLAGRDPSEASGQDPGGRPGGRRGGRRPRRRVRRDRGWRRAHGVLPGHDTGHDTGHDSGHDAGRRQGEGGREHGRRVRRPARHHRRQRDVRGPGDLGPFPEVKNALTSASLTCATA